jgi:nucleoside-diphosphate-sugar epimerase
MKTQTRIAAVTGASGYLGSQICQTLESRGWRVIRLTGSRAQVPGQVIPYELAGPVTTQVSEALRSADVLIHTAYNLSLTGADDIWRVNVEGTRRLLEAAKDAEMDRIIVLSSMSAFDGTSQLYGRAKLDIEAITVEFGGCAVRPGLVYGKRAGGMAGSLRKLTALPVVPVITGGVGVFTAAEDDLMRAITLLASAATLAPGTISLAHPDKVMLADMMSAFAAQENRRCRFIPIPWLLVFWVLRVGESMRIRLPFRADSLLGLIYTSPDLIGQDRLNQLDINFHAFKPDANA